MHARRSQRLHQLLFLIAVLTAISGAVEMIVPGWVLEILGAEVTATTQQLFATVGMFMVVIGGLVAQALRRPLPDPDVLLWGGLQKLGAFVAVLVAVLRDVFAPIAMAVGAFDLLTGVLMAVLWVDVRRRVAASGSVPRSTSGLTPGPGAIR
jgi:hypothetical protein